MTDILYTTTQKIIEDPVFMKIIETKINSIMIDGKINKKDIPDIIELILYCTNNLKKLKLKYKELTEVLEELVIYLLDHFKVIPDEERYEILSMTKTVINLVMFQPKVKSCLFCFK